jgi:hypothetical protein
MKQLDVLMKVMTVFVMVMSILVQDSSLTKQQSLTSLISLENQMVSQLLMLIKQELFHALQIVLKVLIHHQIQPSNASVMIKKLSLHLQILQLSKSSGGNKMLLAPLNLRLRPWLLQ